MHLSASFICLPFKMNTNNVLFWFSFGPETCKDLRWEGSFTSVATSNGHETATVMCPMKPFGHSKPPFCQNRLSSAANGAIRAKFDGALQLIWMTHPDSVGCKFILESCLERAFLYRKPRFLQYSEYYIHRLFVVINDKWAFFAKKVNNQTIHCKTNIL